MGIALFDSRTALEPLRPRVDEAIAEVVEGGAFILGPNVEAFESEFASAVGSSHAVGVANGTEAITMEQSSPARSMSGWETCSITSKATAASATTPPAIASRSS